MLKRRFICLLSSASILAFVAVATLAPAAIGSSSWSIPSTPNPPEAKATTITGVSCPDSTECIAVGYYEQKVTGLPFLFAERWNGSAWSLQKTSTPTGATSDFFLGVSCSAKGACTAVGAYNTASGRLTLAERWNGTEWVVQKTSNPVGSSTNALKGVSCSTATSCVAVGYANVEGLVPLTESWNGSEWSVQKTPASGEPEELSGVSCTASNACTAVGSRISAETHAIAQRWNGTEWVTQKAPEPSGALASTLLGVSCSTATTCRAVGQYKNTSKELAPLAERWSGTEWVSETPPIPTGAKLSSLMSISCNLPSECTAGGSYEEKEGRTLTLVERLRGSSWTTQATPNPFGANVSMILAISCLTSSECTGAGRSQDISGTPISLVERYVAWTAETIANPPEMTLQLQDIACTSATSCMAAGAATEFINQVPAASQWNGTSWTTTTSVPYRKVEEEGFQGGILHGISCTAAAACSAVGSRNEGGNPRPLADGWNGLAWTYQASPLLFTPKDQFNDVSCTASNACTAVGLTNPAGVYLPLVERWNGTAWTKETVPTPPGTVLSELHSVHCISASACVAVGDYSTSTWPAALTLVEVWNGKEWAVQKSPNPSGAKNAVLLGLACLSASNCVAVGSYTPSSGPAQTLAEVWNGTEWLVKATPNPSGSTYSLLWNVACPTNGWCIGVGFSQSSGGANHTLVEGWNGFEWGLQAAPDKSAALTGISCGSSTTCRTIGNSYAETYTE
jgi:hypothetical protein